MNAQLRKTLARSLAAISAVLACGTTGYLLIERGWSLLEAFYMTLITITTIGYGEIRPLSDAGRIFTSLLIVAGIGTAATALTQIGSLVVESRIGLLFGRKKMDERLKRISGHYVICGFGEIGAAIAAELDRAGLRVVVVDGDEARLARAQTLGFPCVAGDATTDPVLVAAGARRAAGLAICVGDLTTNIVVAMAARELNPSLHIVAQGEDGAFEQRLVRAGADSVAYPLRLGARSIAREIVEQAGLSPRDEAEAAQTSVLGYRVRLYRRLAAGSGAGATGVAATSVGEILERTSAVRALTLRRKDGTEIEDPASSTPLEEGEALALLVREGRRADPAAPALAWTEEMSVGIAVLDEEHRMLLGLIARIGEAASRKTPRGEIAAIFDRLVEYTGKHFEHEEALFKKHGYPEAEAHAAEHRLLAGQVMDLNRDREAVLPENVSDFLVDWLKVHILGSDRKYSEFLRDKGLR